MSRFALASLLLACGSPSPTASRPVERPAPVPATPSCAASRDARDVLFVRGNRWRYVEFQGWHSAVNHWALVDEEIVDEKQGPAFRYARIARDVQPLFAGDQADPDDPFGHHEIARVEVDGATWRADCLDPAGTVDESTVREAIRSCGMVEIPTGTARALPWCTRMACASLDTIEASAREEGGDGPSLAALWPGVGIAVRADGSYSAETGDGRVHQAFLVSYRLASAAASPGAIGSEPDDFAAIRTRVHERSAANDVAGLGPLIGAEVQFSLNVEHRSRLDAMASWRADGGLSMRALASATAAPCRAVGAAVVCPADEARALDRCRVESSQTIPRAVFVREGGHWVLAGLLVGGEDDFFAVPEWSSSPALPHSLRATFATPRAD